MMMMRLVTLDLPFICGWKAELLQDRVAVTHNRAWKAMEPDDVVEESQRHKLRGLRVAEGHKVSHLGEAIDDCQDD
jgi:hypothetical protein